MFWCALMSSSMCRTDKRIKVSAESLAEAANESYLDLMKRGERDPAWKERLYSNRKKLTKHITLFHRHAGTLTDGVCEGLDILDEQRDCIFLMTAHQTNFIPYSGVVRKTTLMDAVKKKLEKICDVPVVEFYGIADQDMASSWPWLKKTQLPSIFHKDGVFELSYEVTRDYDVKIHSAVPKPGKDEISKWNTGVREWMTVAIDCIERFGWGIDKERKDMLYRNYDDFMKLIVESNDSSRNFAESNAILLSKVVNNRFGHDTLFSLFTDCQRIFDEEFMNLVRNRGINDSCNMEMKGGKEKADLAPFWYHCECLGKVELAVEEDEAIFRLSGKCPACKKQHMFSLEKKDMVRSFSSISKYVSARARPMTLVFFEGLGVNMYVGGALAGSCYLNDAKHIAERMNLNFPPIAIWKPKEKYNGLGQLSSELYKKGVCSEKSLSDVLSSIEEEIRIVSDRFDAIDEAIRKALSADERSRLIAEKNSIRKAHDLRKLSKKLSILRKIPAAESVVPSIMDYAINIGLEKTKDAWINHLMNSHDISADIFIPSVIDKRGAGHGTS